jgi:expansin (peptidoglycan-binding protein)
MIVDLCPECRLKHGDVDFSIPVYRDITGLWPHRMKVEWEWTDCAAFISGTISIHLKDGSNPYWQAFYFSNMRCVQPWVGISFGGLMFGGYMLWDGLPKGNCSCEAAAASDRGA